MTGNASNLPSLPHGEIIRTVRSDSRGRSPVACDLNTA
uniref:Uncharacterized protein n=1 Tax=uncultured bacterium A1Q1_fos_300 TaxID=1256571 RepID=L7VZV4_9BACT|nr:hypothetical protein [uncultured bacterium A1Q1_fos_300]